jgi:hypothetical protein
LTKMKPNECRCTKKGIEYCNTEVGVRFKGKGSCTPKAAPETEQTPED